MSSELEKNYGKVLQLLKEKIRQARMRANHSVNKQLILLYHQIGSAILEQEKTEGWEQKLLMFLQETLKLNSLI